MKNSDLEYKVLRNFENNPQLTQRQMAEELGLSLGKTNFIIKALLDKGLLKFENFKKSDHKIGYLYLITPTGVLRKTNLMVNFLKRKSIEYKALKEEIDFLKKQLNKLL